MPRDCPYCGQWLSSGDLLQGYCWNCKRTLDKVKADGGRQQPKTKTAQNGDTIHEPDDCRFISSPSGTVHQRGEWPGDAHDYYYHPKCGQRLPAGSLWSRVDAESPEEAAVKYDLNPCGKCFNNSYQLRQKRREAREERRSLDTEIPNTHPHG